LGIYITTSILLLIFTLNILLKEYGYFKYINITIYIYISIFLCFSYMPGSDWRQYELLYYGKGSYENLEIGYYIFFSLFKIFSINFWHYFILVKLILFSATIILFNKINKNSSKNLSIMYYIIYFGIFLWIDCPFRNLIATVIGNYAIYKYLKNDKISSILFITIAISFHRSAIILFFILILINIKMSKHLFIVLFIIINILFFNLNLFANIISWITSKIIFLNKYNSYIGLFLAFTKPSILSLNLVGNLIVFLMILFYYDKLCTSKYFNQLVNLYLIYYISFRSGLVFPIMFRLQFYTAFYFCILIGLLFTYLSSKYLKLISILFMFILAFFPLLNKITFDSRYIPYTNYLVELTKGDKNFDDRSSYNSINSPYSRINQWYITNPEDLAK